MSTSLAQQLDQLRKKFAELDALFRERALRERVLLAAGLTACVFVAIDHVAIQPLDAERRRVAFSTQQLSNDIETLELERTALAGITLTPEEQQQAEQIARLRKQIAEIDARLDAQVAALVSPEAIVSVLEAMLAETPELEMILLESQPAERLGLRELAEAEGPPLARAGLYRHGLRLELEGTFAATLDYLRRLEGSPWPLVWQRMELRVKQFPVARISIDIQTISEQEEWIGV